MGLEEAQHCKVMPFSWPLHGMLLNNALCLLGCTLYDMLLTTAHFMLSYNSCGLVRGHVTEVLLQGRLSAEKHM